MTLAVSGAAARERAVFSPEANEVLKGFATMHSTAIDNTGAHANRNAASHRLDQLGIAASLACAVHCMVAPLLLRLLSAAGVAWSHPSVHWILAALVLPLALIVVYRGYRKHRRRTALIAAVLGTCFIVLGLIVPNAAGGDGGASPAAAVFDPGAERAEGPTCTESCCPSISHDTATGAFSLSVPAGSVATLIGSVFLVLAHAINLHGCYCFSREGDPGAGISGCPTCNQPEDQRNQ